MAAKKIKKIAKPRGKPKGHRGLPDLYGRILAELERNRKERGDGLTAFSLSKTLKVTDPTVRMYLGDLLEQDKITSKKILNMTFYRIKIQKPKP